MKQILSIVIFIFLSKGLFSNNTYTLSGNIKSIDNSEELINATLWIQSLETGAVSDIEGNFSLEIPQGHYQITVSYLGFNDEILEIDLYKDTTITVALTSGIELEAFTLTSTRESRFENNFGSVISLNKMDINNLPSILGEPDLIKSLGLLPGIKSGYETSTGLLVRGGNADQNLFLIDGAPVYNPTHVAGFLGSFSSDIVKNFDVYLGGFPAQYGGKVSSVIDINTETGNNEKTKVKGGVGLLTGKLTVDGPIKKGKSSYLFSIRSFYSYSLARSLVPKKIKEDMPIYNFYDGYGKLNFQPNKKNSFFISGFSGGDKSGITNITDKDTSNLDISWYNHVLSAQWKRTISDKTIGYLEVHNTIYNFNFQIKNSYDINTASAKNLDSGIKYYLNLYPNKKHTLKMGATFNYKHCQPNTYYLDIYQVAEYSLEGISNPINLRSYLSAFYIQESWNIHDKLNLNLGMRLHWYNSAKTNYVIPEPRVSINYTLNKNISLKASYSYLAQFEHLLSNSSISSPFDIWLQTNDTILPQLSHEVSLGLYTKFNEGTYEISLLGYYKKQKNQLGQIPGSNLFRINNQYEQLSTFGTGDSYGFEFFAKKSKGDWTGFLSYTLSWANRTFEKQNKGLTYPAQFDRRNNLSINNNYKINEKWSISILFVYGSGNTITLPNAYYYNPHLNNFGNGNLIAQYSGKNNLRLSAYHRMDIGAKYTIDKPKIKHVLRFDIYNLYNRANPLFIIPQSESSNNGASRSFKVTEFSIIPILPSISWTFEMK